MNGSVVTPQAPAHLSILGYHQRPLVYAVYAVLETCIGGLFWIPAFFRPQLTRWTLQSCSLSQAQFVLTKVQY